MMVDVADAPPAGPFNPIDAVRRLKAAGIDPDQAEAIASEIITGSGGLVTKADLQLAVAELRTEMRTIALSVVAILIAALVAAETLL